MKLNNENYEIWKILMEAILVRKQLRDVALGTTPQPAGPPNAVRTWDQKNQEARAELQLAVEWDQLAHMTNETASEIWAELERVHRSTGFTTRMGLKWTLWKMKMKDGQRMASWIADVHGVAFQLSQIGVDVPDEDLILALTNGLPPTYNNFVLGLDSTPSEMFNIDYVIGCLRTEETRLHGDTASDSCTTNEALVVTYQEWPKWTGTTHITCFGCGQKGHYQVNCLNAPKDQTQQPLAPTPAPTRTAAHNKPIGSANTVELVEDEESEDPWC